jgi:outer membrane protein assembly factor BamB
MMMPRTQRQLSRGMRGAIPRRGSMVSFFTTLLLSASVAAQASDWSQWGGSPVRNNVSAATGIPVEWTPGDFDAESTAWKPETSKNVAWVAELGSQSYGNPVVAGGKAYVGTNNGKGWLKRYPSATDLGCLLAFDIKDGSFLWQDSSEKLPTGRVHDWPLQGICCAPLVEGDRLWYVTSRGEVKCLDTEGFRDGENDGPFTDEKVRADDEADVVWVLDMMKQLGVSQHNMCSCSVTAAGDLLFVTTSNGVDEGHLNLPNADAPSFLCLDKRDGRVLWADGSPGANVLHGQWSSPAYAEIAGVPQVLFGGGDGWLYSFDARGENGKSKLLWQFDCNPKESKYTLGGRADRNHIIGTPVVHDGLVYIAVGEDPEHGEGVGHLWCIDPTKRGDTSPELAVSLKAPDTPLPHRRNQAVIKEQGEVARPNPNSAALWHYPGFDADGNGKLDFEETMHRTCGTVAIQDGLLFVADFSGLFHCLDLKTGKPHWTHDMLAASWGSPLIVDGRVYIGDEDGDISIFKLSKDKDMLGEINMGNSVYSTPIVAGNTLYIANKSHLFAIREGAQAPQASAANPTNAK